MLTYPLLQRAMSAPQSKNAVSTTIKQQIHPFDVKFLIKPLPYQQVVCTYV